MRTVHFPVLAVTLVLIETGPSSSGPEPPSPLKCGPTVFCPGDSLQAKVDAADPGATFIFTPGVYRQQSIRPKSGQTFVGQPGAIMNGAAVLTGWTRIGGRWSLRYPRPRIVIRQGASCEVGYPVCTAAEDLFLDGKLLRRVDAFSKVRSGTWYYNYSTVTVGDDPAGHTVEMSVTPAAFTGMGGTGNPSNVTIKHLVIEKYTGVADNGNVAGAIWMEASSRGWTIDSNEVRFNHAAGIRFGSSTRVRGNYSHHNGLDGVASFKAESALVEGNEIAYNNQAHFNCAWDCGGAKIVASRWVRVRDNYVHDNLGKGIWLDADNIYCLVEGNRVFDNAAHGIFHEIGFDCVIRNNDVERNGIVSHLPSLSGAGILIASSQNVEVYGNRVLDNWHGIGVRDDGVRGRGAYGPWQLGKVWVHHNVIRMRHPGGFSGVVADGRKNLLGSSIRWDHNSYTLIGSGDYFTWLGTPMSEARWRAMGLDTASSFSRN